MAVIWDSAKYSENYSSIKDLRPDSPYYGQGVSMTNGARYYASLLDGNTDYSLKHWSNRLNELGLKVSAFSQNDNILVVGCGFGYLVETIKDVGGNNVWGTDNSPFIHSKRLDPDFVRSDISSLILDIDINSPTALTQFKNASAGNNKGQFTWIITDLVIESLNDSELTIFFSSCDALKTSGQSGVIHIFASRLENNVQDPEMFWRTGEELLVLASNNGHMFLDVHGWTLYRAV